eukprot:SAG22_NODE_20973_length_261_cov_0.629630_1_plen_64_part_10
MGHEGEYGAVFLLCFRGLSCLKRRLSLKDDAAGHKALMDEFAFAHKLPNIIKQGFRQLGLIYFF